MLRVLIYEYLTGGGLIERSVLPPISSEAYAMLNALLKDFSNNAGCETFTLLDKRIADSIKRLAAKKMTRISSRNGLKRALRSALSEVDAALVVAPETYGTLSRLTAEVEDTEDVILLGSSSEAVQLVSNKENAIRVAKSIGVTVPVTVSATTDEGEKALFAVARDIGFPVVIKPQDGAGCEGVFIIKNRQDLGTVLKIAKKETTKRTLLVQEYVSGTDASVSLLSSKGGQSLPLSLNWQLIELRPPEDEGSNYGGGHTPLDHSLKLRTYECACKMASAIRGLKGYVGIDFILTEDRPVFMEVNARITTSYVGLSRVMRIDGRKGVAQAILNCATNDKLPSRVDFEGYAHYSKLKLKPSVNLTRNKVNGLSNFDFVESPPFLDQGGTKEAFLVSIGESLSRALEVKSQNEETVRRITADM